MTEAPGPKDSIARRLVLAALHGALLGAWYGGIALLLIRGTDHAWWLVSLPQDRLDFYFGFERHVLPALASRAGFTLPGLDLAAAMFVAIGAVSGFLVAILGHLLRVDPGRESRLAIFDVARNWRLLLVVVGVPVFLALAVLPFWKYDWPVFLPFLVVLLSPFLVLDRQWLSWRGNSSFPIPRWPGWRVLVCWLAVFVSSVAVDKGLDLLGEASGWTIAFALGFLSWIAAVMLTILGTAIWVDRFEYLQSAWAQRSRLFSWKSISSYAAFDVRIGIVFLWLAAPLLAVVSVHIYVLPQLEDILERGGRSLPHLLYFATELIYDDWWIAAWLLMPLLLAAHGRLYVRIFPRSLRNH